MSNRIYRFILGILLLTALSIDSSLLMYMLISMLIFEGITNLRVPILINKLKPAWREMETSACAGQGDYRIRFEAERAWRLLVGVILIVTYVMFYQALWFFPWFMGFAIVGAGASGICPMEYTLKHIGFRS